VKPRLRPRDQGGRRERKDVPFLSSRRKWEGKGGRTSFYEKERRGIKVVGAGRRGGGEKKREERVLCRFLEKGEGKGFYSLERRLRSTGRGRGKRKRKFLLHRGGKGKGFYLPFPKEGGEKKS